MRFGHGSLFIMVMRVSSMQQKLRQYVSSFVLWIHSPTKFNSFEADWTDGGRDIINFLLHFLPPATTAATAATLPVHLQQVSPEETSLRIQRGFKDRKFVTIGHSYGGCVS